MGNTTIETNAEEFVMSLEEYTKEVCEELKQALEECGFDIEKDAKQACPVKSGHLRRSIITDTSKINSYEVTVGTNVHYARHVEYGTRYHGAKPYLRPAFNKHTEKLSKKIQDIIGDI